MKYLLHGQESDRLRFRLLEESDFSTWINLFSGDNVANFLGLDPSLSEKELCQLWFDKVFNRYEKDLGGMNVLVDKTTNNLIGQCGLLIQTIETIERLEIGYSILPEYWNHGYASEASLKCKAFAFENDFAESLISIIHTENIGSEKVALKTGMQLDTSSEEYCGSPFNLFSIQKEEWKPQKG